MTDAEIAADAAKRQKAAIVGGGNISLAYHRGLVLYYLRQMWIADRHTKSPRDSSSGAFLFPLCRQGLTPRLVAVVSLIEPFADAVGNYTCHDGENKRDSEHIHTPSHCHV